MMCLPLVQDIYVVSLCGFKEFATIGSKFIEATKAYNADPRDGG